MNNSFSAEKFENQKLPFKVKRLSPAIGAELLDIDLREDLNQATLDMIRSEEHTSELQSQD